MRRLKRQEETRPLRRVVRSKLREMRGSFLGPDTSRRLRGYELELDCGHEVFRSGTYVYDDNDRYRRHGGWHSPGLDKLKPPPKRARCDECDALESHRA